MSGSYVFPTRLFAPKGLRPRPLGQALSGGAALAGEENFGDVSGGGRWVVDFGETTLWTPAKILQWRALEAAADGGATPILVPLADRLHQPITPKYTGADTFGLSTWVADATAWTIEEVTATVSANAALGATTLSFTYTNTSSVKTLVPGMHFAILHPTWGWRLYRIIRVTAGGIGAGEATTVVFRTPLREAVTAGAHLNFDSPRCVMRVDGDISADVQANRFGKAQARFVEFPGAPS